MTIPAAGTVPWRRRDGALEVALVHRPKYDDWSWSKGKLDPAEEFPVAAVRETFEETGLRVRLGAPLPETAYRVLDRDGAPATKQVRYWAAAVTGGAGRLVNEIDEVAWLDVGRAHDRLDYAHDRDQLRALLRADQTGHLDTWPLAIVRHARAIGRSSWKRADHKRPLDQAGLARAEVVAGILHAYGILEILTSPSRRCLQTVAPYAAAAGIDAQTRRALSEEGFARKGKRPVERAIRTLVEFGSPVAVCSHGPVLPTILGVLGEYAARRPDRVRANGSDPAGGPDQFGGPQMSGGPQQSGEFEQSGGSVQVGRSGGSEGRTAAGDSPRGAESEGPGQSPPPDVSAPSDGVDDCSACGGADCGAHRATETLTEAATRSMDKGEVLVAHLSGVGKRAVVVAVERHRL